VSGRILARTGRYKAFPVLGLGLMTVGLALLGALAGERSQLASAIGMVVFGLGFGMVTQILVLAVQNSVDRRELGVATATTGFFRALGGAVGAATFGAVFAARSDIVGGVQTVFFVAAPLAALALLIVLALPEAPLQTRGGPA
jgi:MFS family permease